jgi:cytosine/adenosine deaminase-related metal-dependent hydrolase
MDPIMPNDIILSRRALLGGVAVTLSASVVPARAQSSPPAEDVVLAGGMVMTMESGSSARIADIHVRSGEIVAISERINISGARRLDMAGRIVLPGLVDTHWHMWNSLARGFAMSRLGPFAKTMAPLAKVWTPEAAALSVRIAVAEALHSGITAVNNWAHNTKSLEFAEAEYAAMEVSGIRGRFSYGYPQALKPDERMDFDALDRFMKQRSTVNPLLHLGLCTRGPDRSAGPVWREEWAFAGDRRLPITTHIASDRAAAGTRNITTMAKEGLLGPDVQLVHATHAGPDEFRLIKEAGSPVSISPWTELEVGYGVPPVAMMAAADIGLGLSVDNMVLSGNADMFSVMKITADIASGQSKKQGAVSDAKVLDWATRGGALGLGIGNRVGRLAPGLRADIIAVRTDTLNTVGSMTPEFALTHASQPANVEFVMIDGEVRKQGGRLTDIDETALVEEVKETMSDLRRKVGL